MPQQLSIVFSSIKSKLLPASGLLKLSFNGNSTECKYKTDLDQVKLSLETQPDSQDPLDVKNWYETLISKPVVFSLYEVTVQVDKKKGDIEKQTLLSQAVIDLIPFMSKQVQEDSLTVELKHGVNQVQNLLNAESEETDNNITLKFHSKMEMLSDKILGKNWNIMSFRTILAFLPEDIGKNFLLLSPGEHIKFFQGAQNN